MLSPTEKRLASSIGVLRVIARHGAKVIGRRAHAGAESALDTRLLTEIDALADERGEALTDEERVERLKYARSAHFRELAYRSARKRSARKASAS